MICRVCGIPGCIEARGIDSMPEMNLAALRATTPVRRRLLTQSGPMSQIALVSGVQVPDTPMVTKVMACVAVA